MYMYPCLFDKIIIEKKLRHWATIVSKFFHILSQINRSLRPDPFSDHAARHDPVRVHLHRLPRLLLGGFLPGPAGWGHGVRFRCEQQHQRYSRRDRDSHDQPRHPPLWDCVRGWLNTIVSFPRHTQNPPKKCLFSCGRGPGTSACYTQSDIRVYIYCSMVLVMWL